MKRVLLAILTLAVCLVASGCWNNTADQAAPTNMPAATDMTPADTGADLPDTENGQTDAFTGQAGDTAAAPTDAPLGITENTAVPAA